MAMVTYINPQGGLCSRRMSHVATRPPSPLEYEVAQIATCCSHSRRAEPCSGCALTPAYSPWRMETPSPSDPAYLEPIWGSSDRSVCLSRICPLPVVLLPDRGSPQHGCPGTQLVPGSNQVRLSPSEPPCTDLVQDLGGRGVLAGCALLAHPDLVHGTHAPHNSPSLEDSPGERHSFSGDGHHLAPAPRSVEPSRMASGRDAADLSGLPQAVIDTITQDRAPPTRQAYALRWGLFVDWCSSRQEDPQICSIEVVLSFLQEKLERRLSPSTLKIYVAAIAAYQDAVGCGLLQHSLITLTSIKRVGDLHSFSKSCLEFGPADSHVRLRPRPGYVPKV
ncbi:Tyrosine recombinase slr0733 [Labeo rohita]|uniref:Tyrosine recombinase slr0733 n=1 Tax=Labeo rohita TaxID=84645 RepID=A0ABQ8L320_LABRO|nr:Tyrosine recombinase slr0733 [Labeo rohita]